MMHRRLASTTVAAALVLAGAAAAEQTITFAHTDVEGLEELHREFGPFRDALAEATGFDVEFFTVSGRAVAIAALESGKVDFALAGPSEYVVARSRMAVEPVVALGRVDYFTSLIVLAASGIESPQDLIGRTVGVSSVGSTSAHLGPLQLLADLGIDVSRDIEVAFTGSTRLGYEALKRGGIDAWAVSNAAFERLRGRERDLRPVDFRVVARGPDLPNDLILAGGHVPPELVARLRAAFVDPETAERLQRALLVTDAGVASYADMTFLATADDADYDYIRRAFATIGEPQLGRRFPD